jgi:hypothetical protein
MKVHINTIYKVSVQHSIRYIKTYHDYPSDFNIYNILKFQMDNAEDCGFQTPKNWSRQKGINKIKYLLKTKGYTNDN